MAEQTPPIHLLSYEPRQPTLGERVSQRLSRWPLWVIALVLIVPVIVFPMTPLDRRLTNLIGYRFVSTAEGYLRFAAMFLPAAICRMNWRQAVVMAALAAGADAFGQFVWDQALHFPYFLIAWIVPMVGLGEWLVNLPRQPRSLVWIMVLTTGLAFVIPIVEAPAYRTIFFRANPARILVPHRRPPSAAWAIQRSLHLAGNPGGGTTVAWTTTH